MDVPRAEGRKTRIESQNMSPYRLSVKTSADQCCLSALLGSPSSKSPVEQNAIESNDFGKIRGVAAATPGRVQDNRR
jgi:hypothetical protein